MKFKLILALIILSACKNNKEDKFIESFNHLKVELVKSEQVCIEKSKLFFSSMFKMITIDNLILINEIKDPEYNLKIVDLETGGINNFAKRGRGPNEINTRGSSFSADYINNIIYLIDRQKVLSYSVDSLKKGVYRPLKKFSLNLKKDNFLDTNYCNGYIIGNLLDKNLFGAYSINTATLIKKDSPNRDLLTKGTLNNQSFFINHPSKNLIAYFHYSSAINGILSIENNNLDIKENVYWATTNEEIKSGKEISTKRKREELNGFISATADSKYIYALYSGKSLKNIKSQKDLTEAFLSKYIYVFDWDGKPVKKYELDQEVRSIAVDEKTKTIYAASYKGDTPHLIKYKIIGL